MVAGPSRLSVLLRRSPAARDPSSGDIRAAHGVEVREELVDLVVLEDPVVGEVVRGAHRFSRSEDLVDGFGDPPVLDWWILDVSLPAPTGRPAPARPARTTAPRRPPRSRRSG